MPNVRVPDDTTSLHNIGEYIMSYQPAQNAFLTALVNRVAMTIVTSRSWTNPWARFKRGMLEYGETVEEIFVNIAKPHTYDPATAGAKFMEREIPDVRAAFHTMNYQKFYKVTVSNDQLRQAFLSWSGITDLIAKIVDSLYTGMNKDEYLVMKYMLVREILNGGLYPVQVEAVATDPKDAVKAFRSMTNRLTFLGSEYNRAGVENATPVEDQVLIIDSDTEAYIGVNVLADAFNMSQVDYLGQRALVDTWTFSPGDTQRLAEIFEGDSSYVPISGDALANLSHIVAAKVDERWFMDFDNYQNMTQNYNGEGLYWQYWYHVWKTFSVSPFANAIVFMDESSSITGVTVAPDTSTIRPGQSMVFTADVTGTGVFPTAAEFSVSGSTSPTKGTSIDPYSGQLHVARDETASTLTVTATAADGTTSGTATVTVES